MSNPGYEDNAPARKPIGNPAYAAGGAGGARKPVGNPAYATGNGGRKPVSNPGYADTKGVAGAGGSRKAKNNPAYEEGGKGAKGSRKAKSNPAYEAGGKGGRRPVGNPAYASTSAGASDAHNNAISNYLDVTTGKRVSGAEAAGKAPPAAADDGAYLDV